MAVKTSNEVKKLNIKTFSDFEEVAAQVLLLLSHHINVNTLFIAKNDLQTNRIVQAINRDRILLNEGDEIDYNQTFCKLSVDHGQQVLIIPSINKDATANKLAPAQTLGGGSFIGIPIYNGCGDVYGTICGLDDQEINFSDHDVELFRTMASLLTYVLDLDNAYRQLSDLSAPMVPIAKGVGVLPVVGDINSQRMNEILDSVITKCSQLELHYLLIDVSGILSIDENLGEHFLRLAQMLQLIGVKSIFTGIRPDLAIKMNGLSTSLTKLTTYGTMAQAMTSIGFIPPDLSN
ncbi:STAS domain-containing protein [Alkalicoccobacillus murimartini]|uniref:RsbT co-antagonist protein RsbR n=1 Tax=Alkalicoccobacillus murimartini TaxID=171685 RepID=A0ABT9YJ31_9BACI|nr:STAS domain-containing protein [Alkalicoccobacillus murimartini]MDQ0207842.1 rsbT co-antagonist protein RsbR [Alkalicoccobacillus murimartini]